MTKPNDQYNVAGPDSQAMRIAHRQRQVMYDRFLRSAKPGPADRILDVGATSDTSYSSSNYLEAWYPHKNNIVACGIDDGRFLEEKYPGLRFIQASGLDLPFADGSFDVVHSSAVLEHVGSFQNQQRLVQECARVAKRAVFLTTPNAWFPVEFHTSLPLLHWLPKPVFRKLLSRTALRFFADEANLNLMTVEDVRLAGDIPGWAMSVERIRLGGLTSNLVLSGHRR